MINLKTKEIKKLSLRSPSWLNPRFKVKLVSFKGHFAFHCTPAVVMGTSLLAQWPATGPSGTSLSGWLSAVRLSKWDGKTSSETCKVLWHVIWAHQHHAAGTWANQRPAIHPLNSTIIQKAKLTWKRLRCPVLLKSTVNVCQILSMRLNHTKLTFL